MADLDSSLHDLTEADLQETFNVGSFASGRGTMKFGGLPETLRQTHCSPIGTKYIHITSTEEKHWIRQRIEFGRATSNSEGKKRFLSELIAAEGLERYLGTKFPDAKHFSLEDGGTLIPTLKEMTRHADNSGTCEVILGMAYHDRLNVLVNMLGKEPRDLFDEFASRHRGHLGTGDVKHHMGFSPNFQIDGGLVHLALVFNPSHLEAVGPVVIGSVRTRLDRLDEPSSSKVLPITIHDDATMTGQGVVQETLNMSKAHGYEAGGTVCIVINNQVGLTTSSPLDTYSTPYCTDIGKMIQVPILHVNADDPGAVAFVTRLAFDFRNTFKRGVFIDLVRYHRHGHNEADEPSVTQPLMYQKIRKHPISRKIYADELGQEKAVTLGDATEMVDPYRDTLDAGDCVVAGRCPMNMRSFTWSPYPDHEWDEEYPNKVEMKCLQELVKRISTIPEVIEIQSRIAKIYGDRQAMAAGERLFDWGDAEDLTCATLVDEGIPVRLSGEDPGRGTSSHRHAVIHNQSNGSIYTPLQYIYSGQGVFRVWDFVLSEEAVLTFEYGYATAESRALTIQEAQFGDFANGVQVVTGQFISSGEQKWGRMCGLVMLLPHDYERQGPEHSSARLEHCLQLRTEQNMQVCVPSTLTQVYYMLRRQALRGIRRPLVVVSLKSPLRHSSAVSSLEELTNGAFLPAIGEVDELNPKSVKRVMMCFGKVYYDLPEQRHKSSQHDVVVVHIRQLYLFPHKAMQEVLQQFVHVKDFV